MPKNGHVIKPFSTISNQLKCLQEYQVKASIPLTFNILTCFCTGEVTFSGLTAMRSRLSSRLKVEKVKNEVKQII